MEINQVVESVAEHLSKNARNGGGNWWEINQWSVFFSQRLLQKSDAQNEKLLLVVRCVCVCFRYLYSVPLDGYGTVPTG